MAGTMSGSFYANTSTNAYRFILYWTITNQGISGSTAYSDVTFTFKGRRLNTSYNSYNGSSGYSFTTDNASTPTASGSLNFDSRNWANDGTEYTLWSSPVSVRVNHTSTGSRTLPLSFTLTTGTTGAGTVTVRGDAILQDIAMAGTLSLGSSSLTISNSTGPTQTFTIGQYQAAYNYKVEWKIGSTLVATTTIPANNTTTRSQVLGASTWGPKMTNTSSTTVTAILYTYSGSTQIGSTSSATFTLNYTIAPTLSSASASMSTTCRSYTQGLRSYYYKGQSAVVITANSFSGSNGSSLSSYTFYMNNSAVSTQTATSWTSGTLNTVGTITFKVRATDTRGNYVEKSTSISVIDYAAPKFTAYNAYRVSSGSTADSSGTKIYYTATSAATGSGNSITAMSVKTTPTASSSTASVTKNTMSDTLDGAFAITTAYVVTFTATDAMGYSATATVPIPTASRVINVKENKKGIAFGTFATTDNVIETPWQIKSSKTGVSGGSAFLASHGTANIDVGMEVRRTDTNRMIELIIGSGGVNRGLYINDGNMAGWLLYYDDSYLQINKQTKINGNVYLDANNLYAGTTSNDDEHYVEARSSGGRIEISSKSNGRGIWVDGGWVMFADKGSASPIWYGSLNGNASTASNLGFTGTVGASTNLNNITTLGKYYEPSSGSSYMPSNVPPGMTEAFVLYVVSANGSGSISGNWAYGQQILKTISGDRVYMRPMNTNGSGTLSFGDWTLIAGVTKSLWSGTLANSATTIANGYLYNQYIIYGLPSGGSASTVVIPKSVVGTSDTQFELADNAGYRTFKLKHSGYDLIITGVGAYNGGVINSVHGAV